MSELIFYFILGGIIFVLIAFLLYTLWKKWSKLRAKKYRPNQPSKFTCLDGHVVRSKGELIIDNYLTILNLDHEYEQTIKVRGNPIKYDWYLPDHDIYIEYWGFYGKDYITRKEEKLKLYKKGKLSLISVENIMFENIYETVKEQLEEHIPAELLETRPTFCPRCGEQLDKRFNI